MKHGTKFVVGSAHAEELGYQDKVGKFAEVVAIENGVLYATVMGERYTFCPHSKDVVLLYHHLVALDHLIAAHNVLKATGLSPLVSRIEPIISELDNIIYK